MLDLTNLSHFQEIILAVKIATIAALAILLGFIADHSLKFFENRLTYTKTIWDDLILWSARRPAKFLIWILALIWIAKIVSEFFAQDIAKEIHIAKNLAFIFAIGWFGWRIVKKYEEHLFQASNAKVIGSLNVSTITQLLKIAVICLAALMAMQTVGVSITGLVAFGGIGGIALGFAAKDILANFFGATMIYFDHPFSVGDWIRSPDREIEGTVEHIGWRLTHVRNFDRRMIYIPNSIFSTIIVENPSRMTNRRINETMRLRYEDLSQLNKIISEIKNMLERRDDIDQSLKPLVSLNKFGEWSINFFIDAFTKTKDWVEYNRVKQDVLLKVSNIIIQNGAQIAFQPPFYRFNKSDDSEK